MTESVKLEQADFEAIMDRLESGPMNLTGKRWRDTPDDPALAELREHFILPVIEEYVARHKPQEREAVLEEAAKAEYHYIDAFRVIRGAGKSDAAKAKAVAQFVADEIARHQPQEREAVDLDDAIERTYNYMGTTFDPSKAESWKTCFKRQLKANLAALTTPAPAVSEDEIVAEVAGSLDYLKITTEARQRMMRDMTGGFYDEHLNRVVAEHAARAILSRLRGEA